ncbi:universal stress protein [Psychroserpens sp. SPM9]|uniref:universal stress protein n=1 Tax=Psychroserpens sp. SPM9 TaxID=2975598 RepID=UPI0021A444B0|nr:universal stress protein [Psychroserpens sp. SPM9]MDG5490878.1 universal stress protein [Psychroserpens sp. SPM9]
MKSNKYKILVLSDMNDKTLNIIKNGVSLAKMIDADLHFFHGKKPTELVEKESQLSAMRTINKSYVSISNDIQDLATTISNDYDVKMSYSYAVGNLKNEIQSCISSYKPDVIVLGKQKSKPLSFLGDNITAYIIKNFKGAIMIASDDKVLEPNTELSLGVIDGTNSTSPMEFATSILKHTQKPLKLFKINTADKQNESPSVVSDKKTVELHFDYGDNSIKSLSNYLTKSNVNLLYLNKQNAKSKTALKDVINTVNVSMLISEGQLSVSQ